MSNADKLPPFLEIPASMMEKMLDKTGEIGTIINDSIISIRKNKDKFRLKLQDLIKNDNNTNEYFDFTTCGIDGAYVVERLLGTDLLFSCALVTEGLFSKAQKEPLSSAAANYDVFVFPEKHNADNKILARAIMLQMEINLAAMAHYDVIYLDGSLTTALIHMYKAVNMIKGDESFVSSKIKENFEVFLTSYKKILLGESDNKIWIGIPKYTSRNDIGQKLIGQ